jgi:hypothetical protein
MRMMMVVVEYTIRNYYIQVIRLVRVIVIVTHLVIMIFMLLLIIIVLPLLFSCGLPLLGYHQVGRIVALGMFLDRSLRML